MQLNVIAKVQVRQATVWGLGLGACRPAQAMVQECLA